MSLEHRLTKLRSYQHKITGEKSQSPADCVGGILADEMGLGKTLTALSAVVSSLGHAQNFAANSKETALQATLVVVPSECRPPHSFAVSVKELR